MASPIPREAPVTSARLPSSEQNSGTRGVELLLELLERGQVVHRDRLHTLVDALHETGEHVARPDLDERAHASSDQLRRRLRELHRRRQLLDEQAADPLRRLDLRRHRGHERRDRLGEADALDRRLQAVGGAGDERAVEGARDLELDRSSSPLSLGLDAALVDRRILAGDDDLAGRVVVRRPDTDDLAAERLDDGVVEAEDRGHRARALAGRLGHREPALAHQRDGVLRGHRLRGGECRELADRVADDVVRIDPARTQRGEHGEARGDESRVLDLRLDELLERGLEAEPAQVEARRLAGTFEHLHRLRDRLGDVAAHARLERALAGKTERNHAAISSMSFVHSITAEPHVSPAPIPVMSTSSPGRSRPSAPASASASGIDPEDVLPYLSTLTTTRSGGIRKRREAWSMMRTFAWCGTYTSTSSTDRPHSSRTASADETSTRVANL